MSRVVLWGSGGTPLLLESVVYAEDGSVKAGGVVNGGWRYEARNGESLAKDCSGAIRCRWPTDVAKVVKVPAEWRGDYNEIIARAEKE